MLPCYDADASAGGGAPVDPATAGKTLAFVAADGSVDTSTVLAGAYIEGSLYYPHALGAAASLDGAAAFVCGGQDSGAGNDGGASGGVRWAARGPSGASTLLSAYAGGADGSGTAGMDDPRFVAVAAGGGVLWVMGGVNEDPAMKVRARRRARKGRERCIQNTCGGMRGY